MENPDSSLKHGTPTTKSIDLDGACEEARTCLLDQPAHPPNINNLRSISPMATAQAVHLLLRLLVINPVSLSS
ncbi:hypothetical protein ACOMHN_039753 [Nucella lapillus]